MGQASLMNGLGHNHAQTPNPLGPFNRTRERGSPQLFLASRIPPLQLGGAIRLTLPVSLEKMRLVAAGMAAESRYFPECGTYLLAGASKR